MLFRQPSRSSLQTSVSRQVCHARRSARFPHLSDTCPAPVRPFHACPTLVRQAWNGRTDRRSFRRPNVVLPTRTSPGCHSMRTLARAPRQGLYCAAEDAGGSGTTPMATISLIAQAPGAQRATKEMMQPCLIHLHLISLVAMQRSRKARVCSTRTASRRCSHRAARRRC